MHSRALQSVYKLISGDRYCNCIRTHTHLYIYMREIFTGTAMTSVDRYSSLLHNSMACPSSSERWTVIGFQGSDPGRDLRDAGIKASLFG